MFKWKRNYDDDYFWSVEILRRILRRLYENRRYKAARDTTYTDWSTELNIWNTYIGSATMSHLIRLPFQVFLDRKTIKLIRAILTVDTTGMTVIFGEWSWNRKHWQTQNGSLCRWGTLFVLYSRRTTRFPCIQFSGLDNWSDLTGIDNYGITRRYSFGC